MVSVWSPTIPRTLLTNSKITLCLGHYACEGTNNPLKTLGSTDGFETIQICDRTSSMLMGKGGKDVEQVISFVAPHPLRFKEVCRVGSGERAMYAWKAVAPDGYVALGMLCTGSSSPPPVTALRCVPASWCCPAERQPAKLWDDAGAGGGKPGSLWVINSIGLIAAAPGYDPPTEKFYDLFSSKFIIQGTQCPKKPEGGSNQNK